jgi:hypothetical protein
MSAWHFLNLRRHRVFAFGVAVLLVALLARPALAVYGAEWFWTTEGDANPVTYQQCLERAPGALATTGVQSGRNGSWFYVDSPDFHVVLLCISRSHGMNMVLEVAVAGGSRSAQDIGNAINSAFWRTGNAGTSPAPGGNMMITMIGCGDYLSRQITGALAQAPNGSISGQLFGKFDRAQKADIDPANSQATNGGGIHIIAHPDGWASNLEFTGQWDGSKYTGRMHHYTSDDCNFTMTRT